MPGIILSGIAASDSRGTSKLLGPGPIKQVRIDLTDKCNLRCVYCSVSAKNYVGIDMRDAIAADAITAVVKLKNFHPLEAIDLNGHGETTYRNGWVEIIQPLFDNGVKVRLQSNFAKQFSEKELLALSGMDQIAISIDSANQELLRDVRRHVDIRQIVTNITLIRAIAIQASRRPPAFIFSCGLYDKSALHVEELARLAVALGIRVVNFWNLHRHEHQDTDLAEKDRVTPLDDLSDDDLRPRLEAILRAVKFLRSRRIQANVRANFVDTLAKRVGLDV